jgi:hypothetical protein
VDAVNRNEGAAGPFNVEAYPLIILVRPKGKLEQSSEQPTADTVFACSMYYAFACRVPAK